MRTSGDEIEVVPPAKRSGNGGGASYTACVAYGQPTESRHWLNLGTRRKEDQRATEGDTRKNWQKRQKMGFATWSEVVTAARDRASWRRQANGLILPGEIIN